MNTSRFRDLPEDPPPARDPAALEAACEAPVDPRVARSRAKLLSAAGEILVEGGPSALTVDAVAERSGVAKSTLYRHWPSRTALIIDVLRTNMPCTPAIVPARGFEACLRTYVVELAATFADPEWTRMLPSLLALKCELPEIDSLTEIDRDEKIASLAGLLELGVSEGLVPTGLDPHVVAFTLIGPLMMCALTGDTSKVAELAEFTVDRFLAGYRSER